MKDVKQLELTIRTAGVIKSLSNLVGVSDTHLARLMFHECTSQFIALGEFIDKCNAAGKAKSEEGSP